MRKSELIFSYRTYCGLLRILAFIRYKSGRIYAMNYKLIYVDFEPVCRQAGLSADRQALMNAEILKTRYEFLL